MKTALLMMMMKTATIANGLHTMKLDSVPISTGKFVCMYVCMYAHNVFNMAHIMYMCCIIRALRVEAVKQFLKDNDITSIIRAHEAQVDG